MATSKLTPEEVFRLAKLDETDVDTSGRIRPREGLPPEILAVRQFAYLVQTGTPHFVNGTIQQIDLINNLPTVRLAGYRFRLPTEAEWEYAARGGSNTLSWLGEEFKELEEFAIVIRNPTPEQLRLRLKKPNPFGLYDILGMTGEIVSDLYDPNYYRVSPKKDPQGPPASIIPPNERKQALLSGARLVVRGSLLDLIDNTNEEKGYMFVVKRRATRGIPRRTKGTSLRLVLEFIEDDEKKDDAKKKE